MAETPAISLRSLFTDLLDFVYPPVCQICRRCFTGDNIWLCDDCRRALVEIPFPMCPICRTFQQQPESRCSRSHQKADLLWVYSLGTYDDYYRKLIHAFKYNEKPDLGRMLARMIAAKLRQFPHLDKIDAICEVPLYYKQEAKRGYNQSEILAREIADQLDLPYYQEQLIQTKENRDQTKLSLEQRFYNVRSVYEISDRFQLQGMRVLLVDDVTTSGATLNSAATVLKDGGVTSVAAATIATSLEAGMEPEAMYSYIWENI